MASDNENQDQPVNTGANGDAEAPKAEAIKPETVKAEAPPKRTRAVAVDKGDKGDKPAEPKPQADLGSGSLFDIAAPEPEPENAKAEPEKPKPVANDAAHQPKTDVDINESGSLFDL